MGTVRLRPGPLSVRAFNFGSIAAVLLACSVFGACLWYEVMSPLELSILSFVLLPPYLLLVACGLGVWLGFATDARTSRRAG